MTHKYDNKIEELTKELNQVEKDLKDHIKYYTKRHRGTYGVYPEEAKEANELLTRKYNLKRKINQYKMKNY